ncbi:MAG: RelA/SpoT family protein [Patescibacteria group bacterium]|nr:RelA/SpoT family protein [Patescibacteria group bacterium]
MSPEITIKDIFDEMGTYIELDQATKNRIEKAYLYAKEAHEKYGVDPVTNELLGRPQKRKSGEDYIQHPLNTALILSQHHLDPESIVTALLHDVIEDTKRKAEDIRGKFGENTAKLCEGLAKLSKIRYQGADRQVDNLRRMFVAMAEDMRVIFIKLADRLHNMRTLDFIRIDKRPRIARETLEIFVPLAYRLGMFEIKSELENLCFKYLFPVDYLALSAETQRREEKDQTYMEKVRQELLGIMRQEKIPGQVQSRIKHLYSIFKKMKAKGVSMDEIHDRLALRVIVPTKKDCYALLGVIHSNWQIKLGRFKDYIALPKINGYQSLHTVVYPFHGEDRQPTEIQIRTQEMHQNAEYGLAAHWLYSEEDKKAMVADERQKQWIKVLNQIRTELENASFSESLKTDLLENRIFVFTPHGRIIDLPKGATPIDFAFAVHTEVGERCYAAKADNKIIPLSSQIHNGQTISIITRKTAKPSPHWLSFVKTSIARTKIRQSLKSQDYKKYLHEGRILFEQELAHYNLNLSELDLKKQRALLAETPYKKFDDLLIAIGSRAYSPMVATHKILSNKPETIPDQSIKKVIANKDAQEKSRQLGIIVEGGASGLKLGTRACCGSDLGSHIVGYITRGRGIAIHRADCQVIKKADPAKLITAYFQGQKKFYSIRIAVFTQKRAGIFRQALGVLIERDLKLKQASLFTEEQMLIYNPPAGVDNVFVFDLETENFHQVQEILRDLEELSGVKEIRRLD